MLDLRDRKILYALNEDARQSYSSLAKKLRLSKQVVRYRIQRLEEEGIIQSYHALIDWRALGYNSLRIYIRWQNITPEIEREVYDYLRSDDRFMWSVKLEGEVDIAFYVWVKSVLEFSEKWFAFLKRYGKYILNQEIYESVSMNHYPLKPLIEESQIGEKIIGLSEPQEVDKVDGELLKALTENGRMSLLMLAQRIEMTPKGTNYRIKRLERIGVIQGYYTLINMEKLGYVSYKIDFYLRTLDRLQEMEEFAKQHPAIIARMRTIGGADYEIELLAKTVVEMRKIIEEIRIRFPEEVDHFRIHRFEYTLKQIYLPGA